MGLSVEDLAAALKDRAPANVGRHTFLPEPDPREVWATVVSVDDHVVEPPDIFEGRFPKKFADEAPRIVDNDGGQAWLWQGKILPNVGFNAVAGRPRDELGFEPTRFEHMRRGAWDIDARVKRHGHQRRLGVGLLPVVPARVRRPAPVDVASGRGAGVGGAAGLQRLAPRGVVRQVPGAVHPEPDRLAP